MEEGECINTSLALAIGGGIQSMPSRRSRNCASRSPVQFHVLFPRHSKEEEEDEEEEEETKGHGSISRSKDINVDEDEAISGKDTSSFSNDGLVGTRKKLKLTKEQVTLLEDSFSEHNTLNTTQKQYLADQLSIQPRQVEVWFQNRRARTKLKQIEVDYEFLKKCCESLSDENERLKKELQELRSASPGSPFYMHLLKAATLTMCPFCERTAAVAGAGKSIKSTGLLRLKN